MINEKSQVLYNYRIARDVYLIGIHTEIAELVLPGQFVQVKVPGFYLRRPISVCMTNPEDKTLILVYKTVGEGTERLSEVKRGEFLEVFGPLGNGFPIADRDVLLIGGGVGVPPLLKTAEAYLNHGNKVTVILGFNSRQDIILVDEFYRMGIVPYIATMDGSSGTRGTVMDALSENNITADYVLSCGPLPMLKAVAQKYSEGYISLEARMACGIGACMGCVVKDNEGESLRVCRDGPVFPIGKVVL